MIQSHAHKLFSTSPVKLVDPAKLCTKPHILPSCLQSKPDLRTHKTGLRHPRGSTYVISSTDMDSRRTITSQKLFKTQDLKDPAQEHTLSEKEDSSTHRKYDTLLGLGRRRGEEEGRRDRDRPRHAHSLRGKTHLLILPETFSVLSLSFFLNILRVRGVRAEVQGTLSLLLSLSSSPTGSHSLFHPLWSQSHSKHTHTHFLPSCL